jgi:hypothetical protein
LDGAEKSLCEVVPVTIRGDFSALVFGGAEKSLFEVVPTIICGDLSELIGRAPYLLSDSELSDSVLRPLLPLNECCTSFDWANELKLHKQVSKNPSTEMVMYLII